MQSHWSWTEAQTKILRVWTQFGNSVFLKNQIGETGSGVNFDLGVLNFTTERFGYISGKEKTTSEQ